MPDLGKTVEGLEELRAWLKHLQTVGFHGDIPEYRERELTVSDALALLREKEKTKVVFRQYDGSVESECGNCGLYLDKTYSVCPKCGKELDWNA